MHKFCSISTDFVKIKIFLNGITKNFLDTYMFFLLVLNENLEILDLI